jgi:MFS family permease
MVACQTSFKPQPHAPYSFFSQASVRYDGTMPIWVYPLPSNTDGCEYIGSTMNSLQTLPQWRAYFGQPTAPILGTMNAMYPLGKFIRVFISAFIGDRFGQKIPMYLGVTLLILGASLQGRSRISQYSSSHVSS